MVECAKGPPDLRSLNFHRFSACFGPSSFPIPPLSPLSPPRGCGDTFGLPEWAVASAALGSAARKLPRKSRSSRGTACGGAGGAPLTAEPRYGATGYFS